MHLHCSRFWCGVLRFERESDGKGRALVAPARDLDLTFMGFHDAIQHTEANSLTFGFRGEKWIKDLGKILGGNALTGVLNAKLHGLVSQLARPDRQLPTTAGCIA